jgi:hypothetical protein
VHAKYREITPIILSGVLGLLMGVHRVRPSGTEADLVTGGRSACPIYSFRCNIPSRRGLHATSCRASGRRWPRG